MRRWAGGAHPGRVARRVALAAVAACFAVGAGCAGEVGEGDALRALRGQPVEIVGVWQDVETARFEAVLEDFERRTGAEVTYTSTAGEDIADVLDARVARRDPPALALLPQPGLLRRYAQIGEILPIDGVVDEPTLANWSGEWRSFGSFDGRPYGVWFKAAHKSLVWYRIAAFERAGVVPPRDLDSLISMARDFASNGTPAFAVSGDDQWTLTDWFENLYLRMAGPDRYDALAERRLAWTDASVVDTLALMQELLSPPVATGGPDGIAATTFTDSIRLVFLEPSAPSGPAMLVEGDFVAGTITGGTDSQLGIDADVFAFPDNDPARRLVVGGGDAVVMFTSTPASRALLSYLATPAAAEIWVRKGGFVSPNADVDLAAYPDDVSRIIARSLVEAGDGFRFDLSDLQPASFGATSDQGMFGILTTFITIGGDAADAARRLEAAAAAATQVSDR